MWSCSISGHGSFPRLEEALLLSYAEPGMAPVNIRGRELGAYLLQLVSDRFTRTNFPKFRLQIPSRSHCHPPHLRTTAQPLSHCTSAPCTQLDDTGQLLMTVEEGQCHPSDGHGHSQPSSWALGSGSDTTVGGTEVNSTSYCSSYDVTTAMANNTSENIDSNHHSDDDNNDNDNNNDNSHDIDNDDNAASAAEKGCLRGESCARSTEKRNRVVWTRELHACFLDAIKRVGIDLVVPKTILHAMGSPPGVSRESIASHLQKFRIWHRKVKAQGVLDEDLSVDDFLSQRGYEAPHSGTGSMSRRKRQAIMASMSSSGSSLEAGLSSSSSSNNNNNSLNLTSGVATSGNTDSLPSGAAATAMTFTKNNDQLLAKGSKKKYQTTADKGTKKTDPLNSTAVVIKSDAMRQHLHGRGSNVETPEPAETAAAGAPLVQSSSTTSTASAASVVPMSTSGASPTAIVMVASATTSPSAITHEATGASNKLAGSATTISRPSAGSTTSASGTAVASAPSAISEDRTQTGFPGGVPARSKSGQPTKRLAPSSGGMTRAIVGRAPKVAKVWADQLTTKISANQSAIGPISSDDSAVQQQQQEGGCVHDAGLMSGFSCNPACLEGSGMPWQVVPDMDIPLLLPRVSLVEIPSASPCPVAANPHMVGLGVDDAVAGATGGNRSDDGTMARPGMGGGGRGG
eukprot:jgi/Mesvir1/28428/Mv15854-RA.1